MRGFYETKIKHYSEEIEKLVTKLFLVEGLSFTEAEANITEYLTDIDIKDFEILAMKKNRYDEVLYRKEDLDWAFLRLS